MPVMIDDEQAFEVEKVLDYRFNKKKKRAEYLIKFLGYENDFNLWRPRYDLIETCRDMIEKYDLKHRS